MDKITVSKKLERLSGLRICVIGDVMLDSYVYGAVSRISPEAPVPIVQVINQMSVLGGAGNVLANLAAVGVRANLVSTIGNDEAGKTVAGLLEEYTPESGSHFLVTDETKPTIVKKRVLAADQQLLRIDTEDTSLVASTITSQVLAQLESQLADVDAICISDYGKGFVTSELVATILAIGIRLSIPVIVDTKPKNISWFYNCTLISPNESELVDMTADGSIEERAQALAVDSKSNILVTLGGRGVYYADCCDPTRNFSLPSFATDVRDVSGAGDTIIAFALIGLALGMSMLEAATLASQAAAISVSKPHTAVVTLEELLTSL